MDHLIEFAGRGGRGSDGLAADGLFAQFGDGDVPVKGEDQGARDGGRGHHQDVGMRALVGEGEALIDAEAVLLVDHGKPEILKLDVVLKQRVGPDHRPDFPGLQAFEDGLSGLAVLPPGQDRQGYAGGAEKRVEPVRMLADQHVGGRHEGGLGAALDDLQHADRGDHRLAAADIALQEPEHPYGLGEILTDLDGRLLLRCGQLEGQGPDHGSAKLVIAWPGDAGSFLAPVAGERERQLGRQQFVIGEACAGERGRGDVVGGFGDVDPAESVLKPRPAPLAYPGRILPLRKAGRALFQVVERCSDPAGEHALGQALGQRIDRLQPAGIRDGGRRGHEVRVNDLPDLVLAFAIAADHPADHLLRADRQLLLKVMASALERR